MLIKKLFVSRNSLLGEEKDYNFDDKVTLIYSFENAKGKTSLLRLLLYSLGYDVPATKGLKTFDDITTIVEIEVDNRSYELRRLMRHMTVNAKDGIKKEFTLPQERNSLHNLLFGIKDKRILDNLLGVYYIDQDKGWTLLNRGKPIGGIRFSVEDLISGITNVDISELREKIQCIDREISKYKTLQSVSAFQGYKNVEYLSQKPNNETTNRLVNIKNLKVQELRDAKKKLSALRAVRQESKKLPEIIEKHSLRVRIGSKVYPITRKNIDSFEENDMYLDAEIRYEEFRIEKIKKEIKDAEDKIEKRRRLFDLESTLEKAEGALMNIDINEADVEKALNDTKEAKKELQNKLRDKLSNNKAIEYLYDKIYKYSKELGVSSYIGKQKSFVITHDLKGYSGKILSQITFVFKLAYIDLVREYESVSLPIIIDSPRSGEMTQKASDSMLEIIKRDFSDHQLIVASVFSDFEALNGCKTIELSNGVFGTL